VAGVVEALAPLRPGRAYAEQRTVPERGARRAAGRVNPVVGPVYDVRSFGAQPGAKSLVTRAIQAAVDECGRRGGGTVLLPPGVYQSGPLFLRDNVNFHLSAGARLEATTDFRQFGLIDGRAGGVERKVHASLITGTNLSNVSITGRGTLDGNGLGWQQAERDAVELINKLGLPAVAEGKRVYPPGAVLQHPRPRVVNLIRCQGVSLSGVFIERSPHWTVQLVYCDDVEIFGVRIGGLDKGMNTSGIVVDSSRDVRISSCRLSPGDDGISIKSGLDEDGRRVAFESNDVVIDNCTFLDSDGAGVAIGSEMSGGVRNISISNCVFNNVKWGVRLKTNRGRGGLVENIRISSIIVHRAHRTGVEVTGWHDQGLYKVPEAGRSETTPLFRHIRISDVLVSASRRAVELTGLPEQWFQDIGLAGIAASDSELGIECRNLDGLTLDSITTDCPKSGPALTIRRCKDVEVRRLRLKQPATPAPGIELEAVTGVLVAESSAPAALKTFVAVKGSGSSGVVLRNNAVPAAALPAGANIKVLP
jgi:polygalacturonase